MNNSLYILDGHGLLFRAYYAHVRAPLRNSKGENTSAIYGFFQYLKKIYTQYKPLYFVIALDTPGPSFRKKIYDQYKAHRQKPPEDLAPQIEIIISILSAMGIPMVSQAGMEADDIIASIVTHAHAQKIKSVIISSDKDLFQLLNPLVSMLRPTSKSSEWELIDEAWLATNWELKPKEVQDYLAITGDTSDNIPGILGLGDKSAKSLLKKYHSLANIFEHIDEIKTNWKTKLLKNKALGLLSYKLVALNYTIKIPSIQEFTHTALQWEKAQPLFLAQDIKNLAPPKSKPSHNTATDKEELPFDEEVLPDNSTDTYNSIDNTSHSYTLITDHAQFDRMMKEVLNSKHVSIDTETDSLDSITATPVGISLSVKKHSGWYIPISYPTSANINVSLELDTIKSRLLTVFDGTRTIIMHNAKFDIAVLENWGISFDKIRARTPLPLHDTMIAAWVCTSNSFHYSMDELSQRLLFYRPFSYKDLRDDNNNPVHIFSDTPLTQAVEYAVEDTDVTLQLYYKLSEQMNTEHLSERFHSIEMPFLLNLLSIEQQGITLNSEYMRELSHILAQGILKEEQSIYELCEEQFNINSPKQLQEILFNKLKLPTMKKNKTGYSTDIGVLEQLSHHHPVPLKILHYRHLSKLKSTYVDALPSQVNEHTHKIHTSLQQTGAASGRISSTNPNLQNIPVKDEWGRKIRSAFIAGAENVLISADYSQIELKILAHLSHDKNMLEAFNNDIDIHKRTASILFETEETEVSDEQRRIAKTINFGIIYGMSAFRLSNTLQISQSMAKQFIESYFTEFSGITAFIAKTIEKTAQTGYSQTLLGHRCYINNMTSKNHTLRKAAERIAVNATIQGSAADIVKLAMINVQKNVKDKKLKGNIILQIHDELLLECPKSEVKETMNLVQDTMVHAYQLSIPLQVSIHSGQNWGELK